MSKVGKDSEYYGGEMARKIDKVIQKIVPRDSNFMNFAHGQVHAKRGMEQWLIKGDNEKAKSEFERAQENYNKIKL